MFADVTAFVAHNLQDAQEITSRLANSAKAFGLKINIKKLKRCINHHPDALIEVETIFLRRACRLVCCVVGPDVFELGGCKFL